MFLMSSLACRDQKVQPDRCCTRSDGSYRPRGSTDAKDLAPECSRLEAIAKGFRLVFSDDHEPLEHELPVYDALYAYCQKTVG
jgi:hypothetical protein